MSGENTDFKMYMNNNDESKMTTPIIPSDDTNYRYMSNTGDLNINTNLSSDDTNYRYVGHRKVAFKTRDIESGLEEEKSDSEYVCETCLYCNLCIFGLALIAGCVAYVTFGIMYLVQDYNVSRDCKGSNLWEYALVACILSTSRINASNATDKDSGGFNFGVLICLGFIEAGLGIWGGIELFSNSCDDLTESNLWTFCFVTFIVQTVLAFLCLIGFPMFVCIYYNFCSLEHRLFRSSIDNNN